MNKVPLTVAGAEKMREELEHLKRVERPQVIDAIATAREHGDLKENAEYHAAREQQGFIEGRIKDLEYKLSNAEVVDLSGINNTGKVVFASTVKLLDVDNDEELSYKIVGEDEADFKNGMISFGSPIARSLIGKMEGDAVTIEVPGGKREFEILEVRYL